MEIDNENTTEQLKGALSQLIEAYQVLLGKKADLEQNKKDLEENVANLKSDIERLENDKFNLECDLETANEKINNLTSTKQEQNKEIFSMFSKIESLLGATKDSVNVESSSVSHNTAEEFEADSKKIEEQTVEALSDFVENEIESDKAEKPEEPKSEEAKDADGYFSMGNRGGIDLDRMQSLLGGFGKK
jgi:chromosome segregation ATPase